MAPRKKTKRSHLDSMKDAVIDNSGGDPVSIRELMAKARASIAPDIDETKASDAIKQQQEDVEEANAVYSGYDPQSLMAMAETSDAIPANIAAYVQNIESNGHRFEFMKGIDPNSEKIDDELKTIIYMDRWITARDAAQSDAEDGEVVEFDGETDDINAEITDEEVEELKESLKRQSMRESFIAEAWFNNCGIDISFLELRNRKRRDEESVGHAVWECIRDKQGKLVRLSHISGYTMYPVVDDGVGVMVTQVERISPITTRTVNVVKNFPRYVQVIAGEKIYYKTIGDPRSVSRYSGVAYKDHKTLVRKESEKYLKEDKNGVKPDPETLEAHEMIWFEVWSPRTPAGVPRWIGALLSVLGTRAASEINYQYFDNKSIPPAILAINGKMGRQAKDFLRNLFNTKVKGRKNFDKIVIMDDAVLGRKVDPTKDMGSKTGVEFIPLMDPQRGDALFANYSKEGRDIIGANFRQPPALRGETPKDLNRATYLGSLQYGEQQVYSQLRKSFDWIVNYLIMPEILGPGFIMEFVSNSPMVSDPSEMAKLIDVIGKLGGFVPNDLRKLASENFNQTFEPIKAAWGKNPLALTLSRGGVSDQDTGEIQEQVEELENRLSMVITQALKTQGFGDDIKATVRLPQEEDFEPGVGDLVLGGDDDE